MLEKFCLILFIVSDNFCKFFVLDFQSFCHFFIVLLQYFSKGFIQTSTKTIAFNTYKKIWLFFDEFQRHLTWNDDSQISYYVPSRLDHGLLYFLWINPILHGGDQIDPPDGLSYTNPRGMPWMDWFFMTLFLSILERSWVGHFCDFFLKIPKNFTSTIFSIYNPKGGSFWGSKMVII